jgi:hypothetical protein
MLSGPSRLRLLAASATLLVSAAGSAAPATKGAPDEAAILSPLSVIKRADLDFGTLVVSGAGTAVIDPIANSEAVTGPIVPAGTTAHAAKFTATGSKNAIALIRLPKNPIDVTRVGGTEKMTVTNWTQDGATNRRIPLTDTFDFWVGATLNVGANQAEGTYTGTFTVTVQYP